MAQRADENVQYEMQPGDTLAPLADRFMVSEQQLGAMNSAESAVPGRRLRIPCTHGGCIYGELYALRQGETLLAVARRHRLTLADLLEANPAISPNNTSAGQVVVIPPATRIAADSVYTLAEGEGLFDVLRKYGMDVTTFCALNPGINPLEVRCGQKVRVKRQQERGGIWYTLEPGETLVSVAKRHDIVVSALLAANERLRPSDFVPGMRVRIPE